VIDDGVGFNVEQIDKTSHFGLAGMQERAQLVGGEFHVISELGHGTTFKLTLNQVTRP
jgi:two-component system sensor histidine kinase NreB